jgi:DNA-binding response OmpR family regulator
MGQMDKKAARIPVTEDDHIIKPFHPRELMAPFQNALKHPGSLPSPPANRLVYQDLALELRGRQVIRNGKAIKISPTEVRLLIYLMQHPGEVVSKVDLLRHVWGHLEICGDLNLVETAVKRLRQKIEADPKNPNIIQTTWGSGYRFNGQRSSQSNWG